MKGSNGFKSGEQLKHSNNELMIDVASTSPQRGKFFEMFNRSWLDTETNEEEIFDIDHGHDLFMSLLCAINLDLNHAASTISLVSCVSLHQTVLVVAFCRLTPNSR